MCVTSACSRPWIRVIQNGIMMKYADRLQKRSLVQVAKAQGRYMQS